MDEKLKMRLAKQRKKAISFATEYLLEASQQKVCDFLNSGKLDINSYED